MLNQYSPVPRARRLIIVKDATQAQIYAALGRGFIVQIIISYAHQLRLDKTVALI